MDSEERQHASSLDWLTKFVGPLIMALVALTTFWGFIADLRDRDAAQNVRITELKTNQESVLFRLNNVERDMKTAQITLAQDRAWGDRINDIQNATREHSSQMIDILQAIREHDNRSHETILQHQKHKSDLGAPSITLKQP
jgi:hypothetical protein